MGALPSLPSALFKRHCTLPLWYPDHPHHCGRFAFTAERPFQKTLHFTTLVSWPSPSLWSCVAWSLHCRAKRHRTLPLWYPDHPHHCGRFAFIAERPFRKTLHFITDILTIPTTVGTLPSLSRFVGSVLTGLHSGGRTLQLHLDHPHHPGAHGLCLHGGQRGHLRHLPPEPGHRASLLHQPQPPDWPGMPVMMMWGLMSSDVGLTCKGQVSMLTNWYAGKSVCWQNWYADKSVCWQNWYADKIGMLTSRYADKFVC